MKLLAFLICAGLAGAAIAIAASGPGTPDNGFGKSGVVQLQADSRLAAVAVQRDGKVVVVGTQGQKAKKVRALVARLTPKGRLDPKFHGGKAFLGKPGTLAKDVAIERDGDIVVAGKKTDSTGTASDGMLVMRLTPRGNVDHSFSKDGIAITLANQEGNGRGVAVQSDGKIVVAGAALLASNADAYPRTAVARFTAKGAPDRSFGQKGAAVFDFGRISPAEAVVALANGKIAVAGTQTQNLQATNVLAARITSRGTPDRSFGGNVGVPGLFVKDVQKQSGFSGAFDLTAGAKGTLVLAGAAPNGDLSDPEGSDALAIRLTSAGKLDPKFSGDGIAFLGATTSKDTWNKIEPFPGAYGIVSSRGKLFLGGFNDDFGLDQPAVWALSANGATVGRFGTGGHSFTTLRNGSSAADALLAGIAAARDGTIYGVGTFDAGGSLPTRGLVMAYNGFAGR